MKAKEIYTQQHISKTNDLYCILEFMDLDSSMIEESKNIKIEIRYYIDQNFDGERYMSMYSVWFKEKPFMICQIAGRGGRDHREKYVTDMNIYTQALSYIKSLMVVEEIMTDVIDPDKDCKELDTFYGYNVNVFYIPTYEPKYKVGDIVLASVIEDHLRMAYTGKKYVETSCLILRVNMKNPTETYHMKQLDRRWETDNEKKARSCTDFVGNMVFEEGCGGMGADGNDSTIIKKIDDHKI